MIVARYYLRAVINNKYLQNKYNIFKINKDKGSSMMKIANINCYK